MFWKPLRLHEPAVAAPALLASSSFTATSYIISVTDLVSVWSETLDRRSILRRALNDNTSIDPSEDVSQFKILLQKLEDAIGGKADTSVSLSAGQGHMLLLNIKCPLPAPLEPLTWRAELTMTGSEKVSTDLVLPLVNSVSDLFEQRDDLARHIAERDNVIAKLLDKLESTGVELGDVFPGLRNNSTRSAAAQSVRGLQRFDKDQWHAEQRWLKQDRTLEEDVQVVFDAGLPFPKALSSRASNWWLNLGIKKSGAQSDAQKSDQSYHKQNERTLVPQASKTSLETSASEPVRRSQHARDDSETESDGDLDAEFEEPSVKPRVTVPRTSSPEEEVGDKNAESQKRPVRKLGRLGPDYTKGSAGAKEGTSSVLTAMTELDSGPSTEGAPDLVTRPKGRLGIIGGRKKQTVAQASEPGARAAEDETIHEAHGPGGASRAQIIGASTGEQIVSTEPKDLDAKQSSESNSQERADNRRAELKRALEEKAKAPTKKKRKF